MASSNLTSDSGSKPSFVMSSCRLSLSRSRITTFSPNSVGSTETRKSSSLFLSLSLIFSLMRPSCGRRFSEMSSLARILRREVMASLSFSGGFMISYRIPSIRNRTRYSFSYGSTWMSDAPRLMASVRIRLHSLTTGASSAPSASAATSSSSSSSRTSRSALSDCWRSSITRFSSSEEVVP